MSQNANEVNKDVSQELNGSTREEASRESQTGVELSEETLANVAGGKSHHEDPPPFRP